MGNQINGDWNKTSLSYIVRRAGAAACWLHSSRTSRQASSHAPGNDLSFLYFSIPRIYLHLPPVRLTCLPAYHSSFTMPSRWSGTLSSVHSRLPALWNLHQGRAGAGGAWVDERRKGRDGEREGWEDGEITGEWKDGWMDRQMRGWWCMDGWGARQTDRW